MSELAIAQNLGVCLRCPRREHRPGEIEQCLENGRPIHELASGSHGGCPLGHHAGRPLPAPAPMARSIPLAGDLIERIAAAVGADKAMRQLARLTGRPCRCPDRRKWLNKLDARLRSRFRTMAGAVGGAGGKGSSGV